MAPRRGSGGLRLRRERPASGARAAPRPGATAGTLLHEYAYAVLHNGALDKTEQAAREVEAETVVYLAGRRLGLDTTHSARYLAAGDGDTEATVRERLERIQRATREILAAVSDERMGKLA